MSTKKYLVMNNQHEVEYVIKEKKNKNGHRVLSLHYSNSENWVSGLRGSFIMSITNTGDNVIFSKPLKELDYCELEHLRILIGFDKLTDDNEMVRNDVYHVLEEKHKIK
jgi:RNase P protein component